MKFLTKESAASVWTSVFSLSLSVLVFVYFPFVVAKFFTKLLVAFAGEENSGTAVSILTLLTFLLAYERSVEWLCDHFDLGRLDRDIRIWIGKYRNWSL